MSSASNAVVTTRWWCHRWSTPHATRPERGTNENRKQDRDNRDLDGHPKPFSDHLDDGTLFPVRHAEIAPKSVLQPAPVLDEHGVFEAVLAIHTSNVFGKRAISEHGRSGAAREKGARGEDEERHDEDDGREARQVPPNPPLRNRNCPNPSLTVTA